MEILRFGTKNIGEFYHVFNRGVDGRDTFLHKEDFEYFLLLIKVLNSKKTIGSIRNLKKGDIAQYVADIKKEDKLVEIFACSMLDNHYHFVFRVNTEEGLSKFMQKLGSGYTQYFNRKYERSGVLFQGNYKYVLLQENILLLKTISYVNRNHEIHNRDSPPRAVSGHMQYLDDTYSFLSREEGINLFSGKRQYVDISNKFITNIKMMREREVFLE